MTKLQAAPLLISGVSIVASNLTNLCSASSELLRATLITPALLQQVAAGLASVLAYTIVPLIEQAFRRMASETSEDKGGVMGNATAAVNTTQ